MGIKEREEKISATIFVRLHRKFNLVRPKLVPVKIFFRSLSFPKSSELMSVFSSSGLKVLN